MRGILLIAFGHRAYGKFAYNMAHSLKFHSPALPICLVAEEETIHGLDFSVADAVHHRAFPRLADGRVDIAGVKTSLINYSPFDETIYLDCDGICLKDISPLFDAIFSNHSIFSQYVDSGPKGKTQAYDWANGQSWQHFNLPDEAVLTTVQTSIVAFKKDETATSFFAALAKNYENKFPAEKLNFTWGHSSMQPDELYYNATFAQQNIVPAKEILPIFFADKHVSNVGNIVRNHYIMAMYGAVNLTRPFAKDFYDRLMHNILRSNGLAHTYKAHKLYNEKFSGNRAVKRSTPKPEPQQQAEELPPMKLLVKFPTRGRREKFFETFRKYVDMAEDRENIQFIISCDTDDAAMNNQEVVNAITEIHANTTLFFGNNTSKIQACNADMDGAEFDIVLLASDDMIPYTQGYDSIIRSRMAENYPDTDGALWFNDGHQNRICTLSCMGRKYYDRFGYLYHPSYESLWCDNEFTDVARKLNKITFFKEKIIFHDHPMWTGKGEMDELYKRNEALYQKDEANYKERKKKGFKA